MTPEPTLAARLRQHATDANHAINRCAIYGPADIAREQVKRLVMAAREAAAALEAQPEAAPRTCETCCFRDGRECVNLDAPAVLGARVPLDFGCNKHVSVFAAPHQPTEER